jgi:hypothetical protein
MHSSAMCSRKRIRGVAADFGEEPVIHQSEIDPVDVFERERPARQGQFAGNPARGDADFDVDIGDLSLV